MVRASSIRHTSRVRTSPVRNISTVKTIPVKNDSSKKYQYSFRFFLPSSTSPQTACTVSTGRRCYYVSRKIKEGRKEGRCRKKGRKEGRKEGTTEWRKWRKVKEGRKDDD